MFDWKDIHDKLGGFAVSFPTSPKYSEKDMDTGAGRMTVHAYNLEEGPISWVVSWIEYPPQYVRRTGAVDILNVDVTIAAGVTAVALWRDLLKVESIGRNDNFFNMGGHSLLVMRAVSRMRETFGVDVQLRNLFERPTVAELAEVIDGMLWMAEAKEPSTSHGPREEIEI